MINLPKDYPGPEEVKLICTKLLMVGVMIPTLNRFPYHEVIVELQRAYWGAFIDYVINEAPTTNNQQENENAE